jgi:hypothetical protein
VFWHFVHWWTVARVLGLGAVVSGVGGAYVFGRRQCRNAGVWYRQHLSDTVTEIAAALNEPVVTAVDKLGKEVRSLRRAVTANTVEAGQKRLEA